MIYWNPANSLTESWSPSTGWNSSFSEGDKLQYTNLFFFFKNKKGFKDNNAEILAQMTIYKQKYHGIKYSDDQEKILRDSLSPIFTS